MQRPPDAADLRALDQRYSRHDFAEGWDAKSFAAAVMIIISIDRWIAWTRLGLTREPHRKLGTTSAESIVAGRRAAEGSAVGKAPARKAACARAT